MAWSKNALSDERDDSLSFMPAGMFFVVVGGWFLSWWTYFSVSLGVVFEMTNPSSR